MALFWSLCDLLDSGYPDAWCSRLSVSRGQVSGVIGKIIVFSNLSCFMVTGICSTRFGSLFRQGLLLIVFVSDCQVVYLSAQIAEANLQGDEERPGSYLCMPLQWRASCILQLELFVHRRPEIYGEDEEVHDGDCQSSSKLGAWTPLGWGKVVAPEEAEEEELVPWKQQDLIRNAAKLFFPFTACVCCSRLKRKSWRPIELIHAAECTTTRTTSLTKTWTCLPAYSCVEVSRQLKSPWSVSKWKHCWTLPQASWTLVWEITCHFFSSQFSKSFTPSGNSWVEKAGPRDINLELIAEACRKLQDEEPYLQLWGPFLSTKYQEILWQWLDQMWI